jgi:hypothetical protein
MKPRLAFLLCAIAAGSRLAAQPTPPRVRIVEDLRLDATVEDFSAFSQVFVGPRREIVVPLRQDMQLRIYDSTGKRIAAVGRRGAGPGEFQQMVIVGWAAETLAVYDFQTRRMTYVAPDGKVLRSTALPAALAPLRSPGAEPPGKLQFFSPSAVNPDGSMSGVATFSAAQQPGKYTWGERLLLRASAAGATTVIARPPLIEDDRWYMTVDIFGNFVPFMFVPQTVFAGDGKRFAYLTVDIASREGGTFTASAFKANGDTMFVRSFPFRGVAIPQSAVDSALAAMIPPPGRGTEGPPDMAQRFQAIARQKMPPVYAPVQSIILGLDATVWITLRATPEGRVALILDARGTPVGSLLVPPRSRIWQGSATHVWMTETDTDGLSSVVRYRMSGVGCSSVECRH